MTDDQKQGYYLLKCLEDDPLIEICPDIVARSPEVVRERSYKKTALKNLRKALDQMDGEHETCLDIVQRLMKEYAQYSEDASGEAKEVFESMYYALEVYELFLEENIPLL